MSKLEKILALVRSINEDEFQEQLTQGDSLDDVYKELLFLSEKMASKKQRTAIIVEHISNCFAGDFFNYLPISDAHDDLDVFSMGFNTYIEELKSTMVSKKLVETINKNLIEEKERSEKLALASDQFLSNISNEIRTPLNGILGFADLLLNSSSLDAENKNQLESIKMSGDVLLMTINDVLDLVKMQSGKMVFLSKPFNFRQLTRLVQDAFSIKITQKEIDFQISVDEDLPTILLGDSARISQILFNLISNSVKFTPEKGKIDLCVKIQDEEDDFYQVKIVVKDSGIGIPSDKLDCIFNPFIQINTTTDLDKKCEGIGLGLAIVKKIVALMDGEIKVKSKLNTGTKFVVLLPFPKNDHYFSASKSVLEQQKPTPIRLDKNRKIKVLLAEDNRINQLLIQKTLSKFEMDCVAVATGKLAIDALIEQDFDIIIMDLMMPEMNGYEAASSIRNLKNHPQKNIPIIALSAVITDTVTAACRAIGIDKYIAKPFEAEELHHAILELLRKEE